MELKGVVWLGTRTERFAEMVTFAEEVLGLERKRGDQGLAVFELPDGDTFEVSIRGTRAAGIRTESPVASSSTTPMRPPPSSVPQVSRSRSWKVRATIAGRTSVRPTAT